MTEPGPINLYRTRVRTHQTDLNGVMFHGAYFDVFEDARVETFRRAGYTYERMVSAGWYPLIRHAECDFRAPARMDEPLEVIVTVPKLTRATMSVHYDCRSESRELARGQVVFAFLDARHTVTRLPDGLRAVIMEHADVLGFAADRGTGS